MTAPRLRQRLIDAAHVMHERPALTPHGRRERDALAALLLEAAAVMPAPEPIELHAYVGAYEVNGDPHSVEVCALSRTEARRLIDEHVIETHGERFAVSMTRAWPDDGDAASADRRIIVAPGDVEAYMAG